MLEKLYNLKSLNYSKLIRRYYKELKLDELSALVLIEILDINSSKGSFVEADLNDTIFTKDEIAHAVSQLLELDLIEIYFDISSAGKHMEAYRFSPLFIDLEKIISTGGKKTEKSKLAYVFSEIENELKRVLTAREMEQVKSWFDIKSYEEIMDVIDSLRGSAQFKVSNIEKKLFKKSTSSKANLVIKNAFDNMG